MRSDIIKKLFFLFISLILLPINIYASDTVEAIIEQTEITYMDLQNAITNAKSGDTITLTSNVILTEKLTIPENTILTINLNNKNLEVAKVEDNYGLVIKGNLTIEGNGTVTTNGLYGLGVSTKGSLTIKGGTYKNETGDYLIGNWNNTTIEEGNFYGNYCVVNGFQGNYVKITGGNFYNNEDTIVLGKVKISNGTFNKDVKNYLETGSTITNKNNLYYVVDSSETFFETNKLNNEKNLNKLYILTIIIISIPMIFIFFKYYKTKTSF